MFIGMFKAFRSHRFHLWSQRLLEKNNHTMELQMFGEKLVMTDDPENIKAIMDTQVSSYRPTVPSLRTELTRSSTGSLPSRRSSV